MPKSQLPDGAYSCHNPDYQVRVAFPVGIHSPGREHHSSTEKESREAQGSRRHLDIRYRTSILLPYEQASRASSGHAGPPHPPHARASAAARRRHRRPSRAGHQRRLCRRSRIALPGAPPARRSGLDRRRMGRARDPPPRQVLRDHARRPQAPRLEKRNWNRVSIAVNQVLAEES
jgi:hypothetical protein